MWYPNSMNTPIIIPLNASPEQFAQLSALQAAFAKVCNAIAPVAQANRCWNRVALHHLVYHEMRQRFPEIGSQMVCNAIYSVCRSYRLILNHPHSPWNLARRGDQPLPLLQFQASAPVYFDRHTLTVKPGRLSMYTLDGRIRFRLDLSEEQLALFMHSRLREIVLFQHAGQFRLQFAFETGAAVTPGPEDSDHLPEYLLVLSPDVESPAAPPQETMLTS